MDKFTINFPENQKLPDGYSVEFWESDEHYHFTTPDENFESEVYCNRFMARKYCLKYIASLIPANYKPTNAHSRIRQAKVKRGHGVFGSMVNVRRMAKGCRVKK